MRDELDELRNVKGELIEKMNLELVESWSIDPGYEVLQVLGVNLERHVGKSREDNPCERR